MPSVNTNKLIRTETAISIFIYSVFPNKPYFGIFCENETSYFDVILILLKCPVLWMFHFIFSLFLTTLFNQIEFTICVIIIICSVFPKEYFSEYFESQTSVSSKFLYSNWYIKILSTDQSVLFRFLFWYFKPCGSYCVVSQRKRGKE